MKSTISVLIVLMLAFSLMACEKEEVVASAPSEQTAPATVVEQEQSPAMEGETEEKAPAEEGQAPAEEGQVPAGEEQAPAAPAEQK